LRRRGERLVQGARKPPRAPGRALHAHALLRHRDPPLPLARAHSSSRGKNRMIVLRSFAAVALSLTVAASVNATLNTPMSDATDAPGPQVNAPAGAVRGTTDGSIRVFKGIPFAQP